MKLFGPFLAVTFAGQAQARGASSLIESPSSGFDFTSPEFSTWNLYTRELYDFILPFWQAGDNDDTNDDTDALDLQDLLSSISPLQDLPGYAVERAHAFLAELEAYAISVFTDSDLRTGAFDDARHSSTHSFDAYSMVVALIDGLVISDFSLALTTDLVPIDLDYVNADIYTMTANKMDELISASNHNGQFVRDHYRDHIANVAGFDNMATMAWNLLSSSYSPCSYLFTPAELDAAVLAVVGITQDNLREGSVMMDVLNDMRWNMQTHDLMKTDSIQAFFNTMYQNKSCCHATRNLAAVMEVANTLTDQQTVSDTLIDAGLPDTTYFAVNGITDENIMAAIEHVLPGGAMYYVANAGDFNQDPTTDLNHQIALKASELAGANTDEQAAIATGMSDFTPTPYVVSMDRAIEQLSENSSSKRIYQQIVTEFFESADAGNLGDLFAAPDPSFEWDLAGCIESMKNPSYGSPAEDVRRDLMGCMFQSGIAVHVERLNELFDTDNMNGLNAVLTLVSSIDADTTIDDAVVDNMFGCGTACDFTGVVWTKSRAAEDAACGNAGVGMGSASGSGEGSGDVLRVLNSGDASVRDGAAIDQAFYDALWTTATAAESGSVPATSNWCAVNACLACVGDTKAKVIAEQHTDETEVLTCVCPAPLGPVVYAPVVYGQFVMDFIDNFPRANLSDHERQCVGESLAGLMTPTHQLTPALDSIIRHILADLQQKDDLATLTNVQKVLISDEFRFNGGMVIETLISTQNALEDKATVAGVDPDYSRMNAWDFLRETFMIGLLRAFYFSAHRQH